MIDQILIINFFKIHIEFLFDSGDMEMWRYGKMGTCMEMWQASMESSRDWNSRFALYKLGDLFLYSCSLVRV